MGSQLIVLLLFEGSMTYSYLGVVISCLMLLEQMLDDWHIVEETVDIGANAMTSLHDRLVGIADTLMNLVALTRLTFKLESDLPSSLLRCHGGVNR